MRNIFKTRFAGLELVSPIIIGSSGLTNTAEKNKELEKAGAGAVILKSLFEEQIEMQSDVLSNAQSDYPETDDYIRNYVKTNQITNYLNLIQESKKLCSIPVIASINCYRESAWTDFARQIEMAGADAIELNIFAINTEKGAIQGTLEDAYLRITQKVKEVVNIPVIIKMSKYFSNIINLINNLQGSGADGVVLFNRFYQPDIDVHKMQVNSGQLFSSNADISDTLRWTAIASGNLPKVSIASSTGIHDWEDIIKCILCGASAVELCSTVYQHGNEIIAAMKRSIEEWMNSMNFNSLSDFKGRLDYKEIPDPSLYERVQFMKYFSNRD